MKRVNPLLSRAGAAGATVLGVVALGLLNASPSPATAGSPATAPAPAPTAAAPQAGFGTIKGRLVWGGAEAPKRKEITDNKKKDPEVCAKVPLFDTDLVVDEKTKGVGQAFAFLPSPKGKNPEAEKALLKASPEVVIDQVNCEYVPYSTAAHKDQTINFKSSDPAGHNVHYTGFTNNANFALGPNGSSKKKLVAEKRPVNLTCDIHPWMKGNLMVFDHPFFAVTGADGSFEIKGVPAGKQNLIVWQRKAGYVTEGGSKGLEVTVKAGDVIDLGEIKLDPTKIKN